jgi:putative ABC transport system permease protein
VGDPLAMGRVQRKIVGAFTCACSIFESEVWVDLDDLAKQFHREGSCSTVLLHTADARAAGELCQRLNSIRQLSIDAQTEPAYYLKQSDQTQMLQTAGITVAFFMGIGAVFGVANTMFAAIGQRTRDIAVMRLLGFRKHEILISFLIEALLIAAFGGLLGTALGYSVNGISINSVLSAKSVAFAFTIDSMTMVIGLLFTLLLGVVGGVLPAMAAMRIDPLQSLR